MFAAELAHHEFAGEQSGGLRTHHLKPQIFAQSSNHRHSYIALIRHDSINLVRSCIFIYAFGVENIGLKVSVSKLIARRSFMRVNNQDSMPHFLNLPD